jgi:TolA-binding protein
LEEYTDSDEAAEALIALGKMTLAENNYQNSFDYYSRLLEKGSAYRVEAYTGMGNARIGMGRVEDARQQYQSALEIDGSFDAAKVGLAKAALQQENYEEALQHLSPVAEANTTAVGAEAQYLLGVTFQEQGEFQQALDEYANVQVLYEFYDRWVAKSLLKSGEAYIQLGNNSQARKVLQSLMNKYPRSSEAQQARQMLDNE